MNKLLRLIIFFTLFNSAEICAQSKLGNEWITGRGAKIEFINNNIITKYNVLINTHYFHKGHSNICDTNGNLILCSDGYNVYNSNAMYIDNGDTLVPNDYYSVHDGFSILPQTSIFLPIDSNMYYFVSPAMGNARYADCLANNHCFFDLLLYNVIDMNANAGAGKVVKRMQPLMTNAELSKSQMMACRHSNGKDWWLLKMGGDSNKVYKFLFQQDTVINYGSQTFSAPVWGTGWDLRGQCMFSQDGGRFAATVDGIPATGEVFIADFDRCYGVLSYEKVIVCPEMSIHNPNDTTQKENTTVGVAFSPNGNLLYVMSPYNLWQYDLQDNTWFHVAGLDTSFAQFQLYSSSYLGADNKLYIGNYAGLSKQMSVINNPDVKGAGCNFCPRCLRLDTLGIYGAAGTPPCMPNYSLGAKECWPLSMSQLADEQMSQLEVYPNPTSTAFYIKTESKQERELYNSLGQLLISTKENEIDVNNFSKGMYYLKCGNAVKKVIIE